MINVVYARTSSYVMTPDGGGSMVQAGTHWPANDPIVLAQPSLFSADPRFGLNFSTDPGGMGEPPVEQVTAGPGEKRAAVKRG